MTKENKILVTLKQRLELLECPMRTVGPECVHKCRGSVWLTLNVTEQPESVTLAAILRTLENCVKQV